MQLLPSLEILFLTFSLVTKPQEVIAVATDRHGKYLKIYSCYKTARGNRCCNFRVVSVSSMLLVCYKTARGNRCCNYQKCIAHSCTPGLVTKPQEVIAVATTLHNVDEEQQKVTLGYKTARGNRCCNSTP